MDLSNEQQISKWEKHLAWLLSQTLKTIINVYNIRPPTNSKKQLVIYTPNKAFIKDFDSKSCRSFWLNNSFKSREPRDWEKLNKIT